MKPGISSYTYTWAIGVPGKEPPEPMTIFQLIGRAAESGVHIVQVADNLPLHNFPKSGLQEIKKYADNLGVRIEVGSRKMTEENLAKYIEIAAFFESPVVRFVIDGDGFQPSLQEIQQIIENAVTILEKNAIILAIENHDRFKVADFIKIVESAGSKFVAICLDSVNSLGAGEGLETVIGKLAPFTVNLHVKEFTVKRVSHKMGFVIEGSPLGEGMLPLPELLRQMPEKCHSAILEQWVPPEATLNATIKKEALWAEKSIKYLKSILHDV